LNPLYKIVETRNIAAPLGDGTGITFDGTRFWILGPTADTRAHRLVEYDPTALTTHRQFTLTDLAPAGGINVGGITWDGASIWVVVSGNRNELLQVDPANGNVIKTRSSPGELGPSDLDFDGRDLWLSDGVGEMFLLDRITGGIKRSFLVMDPRSRRDNGIAFRTGELWIGALFGGMDVYNAETGAHLGGVVDAQGVRISEDRLGSSCFANGQLVILSSRGITSYDLQRQR
jgi:hypothetical protein